MLKQIFPKTKMFVDIREERNILETSFTALFMVLFQNKNSNCLLQIYQFKFQDRKIYIVAILDINKSAISEIIITIVRKCLICAFDLN